MPVQVVITDDETDTTIVTDDPSSVSVVEVQVPGPQGPPGGGGGAEYPPGGTTGQVLSKNSNADNDVEWSDPVAGADGSDGAPGADGDSAYQVAVANGFVGSEAAWLASLVGAPGADGDDGAPGAPGADGNDGAPGADGADGLSFECHDFSVRDAVTIQTGKGRIYFHEQCIVESVVLGINTAPTGSALIVDVNKNGTTIFTTQANRPQIAASAFTGVAGTPQITTYDAGDYMSCDVDQVGSTVAGSDLTVSVRLRRA